MIDPEFLSVSELASRWNATERQILEHGAHLRLPVCFLFDGLALNQAEHWLMGHGAADEERELENKRILVTKWEAHLRRNAAGLTDEFSRLDRQGVMDLREMITEYEVRIRSIEELLSLRADQRKTKGFFGYLRLPPRTILDLQAQPSISFPLLALNQAGELLRLEPGVTGHWKSSLSVSDLLVPLTDIKAIEKSQQSTDEHIPAGRPLSTSQAQEQAILEAITRAGYQPTILPPRISGKPWVKNEMWLLLKNSPLFTSKSFDNAWGRLRSSGDISERNDQN